MRLQAGLKLLLGLGLVRLSLAIRPNTYFEHTLLKADATIDEIKTLCEEAEKFHFSTVCVNSCYIKHALSFLTNVPVCAVIGFPLGSMSTESKVAETVQCIHDGAREIDMVMNVGMLKSKEYDYVKNDIKAVVNECKKSDVCCKVILEMCLLTEDEKMMACDFAIQAGAHFVKTSTGFSSGGATVKDVALLANIATPKGVKVKASGGIRNGVTAKALLSAGAVRLGTSATVTVYEQLVGINSNDNFEEGAANSSDKY